MDKNEWSVALKPYTKSSDGKAFLQLANTLLPYGLLWWLSMLTKSSIIATAAIIIAMSFFLLRTFSLMHDCGHLSLFRTRGLNKAIGLVLGVLAGIPQYVWSKHHAYHHATNGDWQRYPGPLNVTTRALFEKMSVNEQKRYLRLRHPATFFLLGGFLYLLVYPRLNWFRGGWGLVKAMLTKPSALSVREVFATHRSRFYKTPKELIHMSLNNVGLIGFALLLSLSVGWCWFLLIHSLAVSISGSMGLLFFTIQHNFESSYASASADWDYCEGALKGTSFLTFPRWLNWFSADIAYHHVHHLSAAIPNYQLKAAHRVFADHFDEVKRLSLADVLPSFAYNLWDEDNRTLVRASDIYRARIKQEQMQLAEMI